MQADTFKQPCRQPVIYVKQTTDEGRGGRCAPCVGVSGGKRGEGAGRGAAGTGEGESVQQTGRGRRRGML